MHGHEVDGVHDGVKVELDDDPRPEMGWLDDAESVDSEEEFDLDIEESWETRKRKN